MILHFDVGRIKSIKALEEAMINNQLIYLVAQKDAKNDSPTEDDIYRIGTICKVKQIVEASWRYNKSFSGRYKPGRNFWSILR